MHRDAARGSIEARPGRDRRHPRVGRGQLPAPRWHLAQRRSLAAALSRHQRPPAPERTAARRRHFCIVTNRSDSQGGSGLNLIRWHRQKAGTIEHAHDVLMNELAGATLPSQKFGARAVWMRPLKRPAGRRATGSAPALMRSGAPTASTPVEAIIEQHLVSGTLWTFAMERAPIATAPALAEAARRLGAPSTPYGKTTTGRNPVDFCDGGAPLAAASALAEGARRLAAPSTPYGKTTTGRNPVDFCDGGALLAADSALGEAARRLGAPSTPVWKATTGRNPVDFCEESGIGTRIVYYLSIYRRGLWQPKEIRRIPRPRSL
jgi:hypothetical protein